MAKKKTIRFLVKCGKFLPNKTYEIESDAADVLVARNHAEFVTTKEKNKQMRASQKMDYVVK